MELLLIPIALICFGAFLGLGISIALGAVTILGTILVAILSLFAQWIPIAILIITFIIALPFNVIATILVGLTIFFTVAWFAADDEAVKDDFAKKALNIKIMKNSLKNITPKTI